MAHLCVHKVSLASGVGTVIVILGIVLGWYGFPYVFNKNVAQVNYSLLLRILI